MTNHADDEPLEDVSQIAQYLNVPKDWVYAKAGAAELPHYKVGRYLRFRRSEVARYLAAVRRGPQVRES